MTATGNAKHQAARATTADRVATLRTEISAQLAVIGRLHAQLADLADTRQSVGLPFQTPAARDRADQMARLDRVAARTPNSVPPSGPVAAPVTMPAVAASAEILFTLRQHLTRFTRALIGRYDDKGRFVPGPLAQADLAEHAGWHAAMADYRAEREQWRATIRRDRDAGLCAWPPRPAPVRPAEPAGRNPLVTDPPVSDADVDELLTHLRRVVEHYISRAGLASLLRELEHLEDVALTVLDGVPASEPAPRPTCPWCGRDTLALIHRERSDDVGLHPTRGLIRCVGRHECRCTHPTCACHRGRRHEWHRAAGAADTWTQLANLQTKHQELITLETKALDALERIRGLHRPEYDDGTPAHVIVFESDLPDDHECSSRCYVYVDDASPAYRIGEIEGGTPHHAVPVCAACGDPLADQWPDDYEFDGAVVGLPVFWPCPTIRALDPDQTTTDSPGTDSPDQ